MIHIDLRIVKYAPLKGASYIPLPKRIKDKKAIVNIKNNDQKCFMWSVLAALHPETSHPERVSHYDSYEGELNMNNIEFPMKISQLNKFERQNSNVSINVIGYEDDELFPVYISKEKKENHVNLLLISNHERQHYCYIKNLSRLLNGLSRHHGISFHCTYCLHGFTRRDLLDKHEPICGRYKPQKIYLPKDENRYLSFTDVSKQLKVPFVIYADFESIIVKTDNPKPDGDYSYTHKTQHHQPCGFSYCVVSSVQEYCKEPIVYRGEDAIDVFLQYILEEEKEIKEILNHIVPMELSEEEEESFQNATHCHICNKELGIDRVRNHCHLSGNYFGAAHNACNLQYKYSGKIPVFFHNLRNYDSHLIMKGIANLDD